jgi:hypothetical protein
MSPPVHPHQRLKEPTVLEIFFFITERYGLAGNIQLLKCRPGTPHPDVLILNSELFL